MPLIYSEIGHLVISLTLGWFLYKKYKTVKVFLAVLATGFFIDTDHWIDYINLYGLDLDIRRFFSGSQFQISKKVIIPLHGWEYIPVLWIFNKYSKRKWLFISLSAGLAGHLIWDQITNPSFPFSYFLTYRFLNNFDMSAFHPTP